MHSIWMAIRPTPGGTRLLTMQPPHHTILQARLLPRPSHPRALPFLMGAIALWQGSKVHAALYVDESVDGCAGNFFPDPLTDPGGRACAPPTRRRRNPREGARDFRDLQQLLFERAAR